MKLNNNIICRCSILLEFSKSMKDLPLLSIGGFAFTTEDNKEFSFDFTDAEIYIDDCNVKYEMRLPIDKYFLPLNGKEILETLPKITKFYNLFIDEDWEGPEDVKIKEIKEFSLHFYTSKENLPQIPNNEFWDFSYDLNYLTVKAKENLLYGCIDKEWLLKL